MVETEGSRGRGVMPRWHVAPNDSWSSYGMLRHVARMIPAETVLPEILFVNGLNQSI
jgi:5-deoxy-D-glucuronate isomerase